MFFREDARSRRDKFLPVATVRLLSSVRASPHRSFLGGSFFLRLVACEAIP